MNYCNPHWNNDGVLSELDKKGIRAIYGTRSAREARGAPQAVAMISDSLGEGQLWENVYVEFGGNGQSFQLNSLNRAQTRGWNLPDAGSYPYKVWTYTLHSETVSGYAVQTPRWGYGEGVLTVEKSKINAFSLYIADQPAPWNPGGYWNLTIKNTPAPGGIGREVTLREIETTFKSGLIDDTIKLAIAFLHTNAVSPEANAYLGLALMAKNDVDNAVTYLEKAVSLGQQITIPVRRVKAPFIGHVLENATITISAPSVVVTSGGSYFKSNLSQLTGSTISNYNNQCSIAVLNGTFIETFEKSAKMKQEAKVFNLFPPNTGLQQVKEGNLTYNVAVCDMQSLNTTVIIKLLSRLMARTP
jgi:hypothetical protein